MTNKRILYLIGYSISFIFIGAILSRVEWVRLWSVAGSIRWPWILLCFTLFLVEQWLRAVRWRYFFPLSSPMTGRRLFAPLMVGYACNCIFPGRVGEFARAYLVSRQERIPVTSVLATVFIERVADSITLLLGFCYVLMFVRFDGYTLHWGNFVLGGAGLVHAAHILTVSILIPLILALVLFASDAGQKLLLRLLNALGFLPQSLRTRGTRVLHNLAAGFSSIKTPANLIYITIHSLLIWGIIVLTLMVLGRAFAMNISVLNATLIIVTICLMIFLPSAPAAWGLFEVGFLFGAGLAGMKAELALLTAMALLYHLVQFVAFVAVGMICSFFTGYRLQPVHETQLATQTDRICEFSRK